MNARRRSRAPFLVALVAAAGLAACSGKAGSKGGGGTGGGGTGGGVTGGGTGGGGTGGGGTGGSGTDGGLTDGGGTGGGGTDGGTDAGLTGTVPDPTKLPHATEQTRPNVNAYVALNVPSLAAGHSYQDPETGVRIYKLTDSTFPATGQSFGHDYFEGNYEVSEPYTSDGKTRAVLVFGGGTDHYLIDFTPGVGVSNARPLTGTQAAPNNDIAFTFSDNPATPWYAYVLHGSSLVRIDIRTMNSAPGGGFPVTGAGSNPTWLQQSVDDREFVWMSSNSGPTFYHYAPATGTMVKHTDANINEPRFDRAGRYVVFSMSTPQNGLDMWDTKTNTITWTTNGSIPMAHQADLQDLWVGNDWNMTYPFPFDLVTPAPNTLKNIWGPSVGNLPVGNGGWIQYPTSGDQKDAWTVWNSYGSLNGTGSWPGPWLAPGGIVLMTVNGGEAGARLLGHPYSTQNTYWDYAWPKFTADGKYVLFTSDMDGSGRWDLFLAEMPTRPK